MGFIEHGQNLHSKLQTPPPDRIHRVLAIGLLPIVRERDQGQRRRFLVCRLREFRRVRRRRLPGDDDEAHGVPIDGFDGGDRDFGVADRDGLARLGQDDGQLPPWRDQRAADLEQVPAVARQLGLQHGPVVRARGHLRQEEHAVELGRELELLHAPVLVDDGVLVLGPAEGQKLLVVVDRQLGAVVPQVLDDLLVRWVVILLVRPLQVGITVVLC